MSSARAYFVITTRGQIGPFDGPGLREALRAGEIGMEDQVRSALGSPKGSVAQVLRRDSDRMRRSPSTATPAASVPPAPAPGPLRGPVPIIVLALLGIVAAVLLLRSAPDRATPPSGDVVPAPVAAAVPAAEPSIPVASTRQLADILGGLPPSAWTAGGGAQVRPGGTDHAWNIGLPGAGAWACVEIEPQRRNLDTGTGLLLRFAPGGSPGPLEAELVEPTGERFVSAFTVPTGGALQVQLPWPSFSRRSWQPEGASDDGLQRRNVASFSLLHADPRTMIVRLVSVGIY